jgi:uncharacterized protein YndB with AHSA1/START domain
MTITPQTTAVTTETVVEVSIERAFRVFTEDFDRIKPRDHNLLDVEIEETVFETHAGGNIYDRGVDGTECRWARVLAFEAPHRLLFSWTSARSGNWKQTQHAPARSRFGLPNWVLAVLESRSSTATSTATVWAGKLRAMALAAMADGCST